MSATHGLEARHLGSYVAKARTLWLDARSFGWTLQGQHLDDCTSSGRVHTSSAPTPILGFGLRLDAAGPALVRTGPPASAAFDATLHVALSLTRDDGHTSGTVTSRGNLSVHRQVISTRWRQLCPLQPHPYRDDDDACLPRGGFRLTVLVTTLPHHWTDKEVARRVSAAMVPVGSEATPFV